MASRTCTVICNCGPNLEPLRCGYKPSHKGKHSWATLPTFVRPPDVHIEIHPARDTLTSLAANGAVEVIAPREYWSAVCSSLGEDFPHVGSIRSFLAASPVSSREAGTAE